MSLAARTALERLTLPHDRAPDGGGEGAVGRRLADLSHAVLVLLEEVEALRAALIAQEAAAGQSGARSAYARAYRETALLTHNSAGVTPGIHKLLRRFDDGRTAPQLFGEPLREVIMLARLGFADEEIQEYIADAERAGTLT